MPPLPDEALVVRGGINTIELLQAGSGVTTDAAGKLHGLSVNSASGKTIAELTAGLPNRKIGVTTVGAIRAAGGKVVPYPISERPDHCLVGGVSIQAAYDLLNPPVPNPNWVK